MKLLKTGRGGGVWRADEHPAPRVKWVQAHTELGGQAGDHRPEGQVCMEERRRERSAERARPDTFGVAGNSSDSHSNSKRTSPSGKLYFMFKTEMLFPQRPWNMERMLFGFQGPLVGMRPLPFHSFVNVFNVSIFTFIEQASVTLISQDC